MDVTALKKGVWVRRRRVGPGRAGYVEKMGVRPDCRAFRPGGRVHTGTIDGQEFCICLVDRRGAGRRGRLRAGRWRARRSRADADPILSQEAEDLALAARTMAVRTRPRTRRSMTSPSARQPAEASQGNLGAAGGTTSDPVRMFLRDIGNTELLTREQEIALAQRLEAGEAATLAALCECPATFAAIAAWRDALQDGRIGLRDLVELDVGTRRDRRRSCPRKRPIRRWRKGLRPETLARLDAILAANARVARGAAGAGRGLSGRGCARWSGRCSASGLRRSRIDPLIGELKAASGRLVGARPGGAWAGRGGRIAAGRPS